MGILFLIVPIWHILILIQKADSLMQVFKPFRTGVTGGLVLFILLGTAFWLTQPLQTLRLQPSAERVTISASDGLTMVGDFYRVPDADTPMAAVLLLHGQGSERSEWVPLIQPLLDAGFHVLSVDQRSFGETGGIRNLGTMIDDAQQWLEWLSAQPQVKADALATVGSSMGAVPALGGCAAAPQCQTSILISPGDFPLLDEPMYESLRERSALFIVAQRDTVIYDTRRMFERMVGDAAMHVYEGANHGSGFFTSRSPDRDRVLNLLLYWLDDHLYMS